MRPSNKLPIFAGVVAALLGTHHPDRVWVERVARHMGTTLEVGLASTDRNEGFRTIEAVFESVRRTDGVLNDWRQDSEISRVNSAEPGKLVEISDALTRLLVEAADWTRRTGGAFDPGIGAYIDAWDFRGAGRHPSGPELARARKKAGLLHFHLDPLTRSIVRPVGGSWIDAGGFGKGAALRAAAEELAARGILLAFLNFGGQVLALGDSTWTIAVAHPLERDVPIRYLHLNNASASTTAQSQRYVEVDGARYGHVFDPRSGEPIAPWGSVTVVHEDPLVADVLSTALFVMGPEAGMRWLEPQDLAALFLIVDGGRVIARATPQMQTLLIESPHAFEGE